MIGIENLSTEGDKLDEFLLFVKNRKERLLLICKLTALGALERVRVNNKELN
jgi:hypothetical protein